MKQNLDTNWESKNRLYKYIAIVILFISVLVIIYDYTFNKTNSQVKGISKIVINGHNKVSKEEVIELLDIKDESSIEGKDTKSLEKLLLKHPRIKSASVSKRSKDQLLITINEYVAKFILNVNDNLYELNEEYKVISTNDVREPNLLVVSGDFQFAKGNSKKLQEFYEKVDKVFTNYPKLFDRISEIHLSEEGEITLYAHSPEKFKIYVGSKLEALQARKLYSSLAYFETKQIQLKLLDIRGEDAVYQ
jgi:cell division protein FtsQ